MRPRRQHTNLIATILAASIVLVGCGFDPTSIPVPGTTVSGPTYRLHIQFANVLNLPPGAKVIANGLEVGNLTALEIAEHSDGAGAQGGYVLATVNINESVRLPVDTTAELRQATPLGDVHIALINPPGETGPMLQPDATIPIGQTKQAVQVEDTLAGLATAVGGGLVTDFQDIIRQLNAALPADPHDTARISGVVGNDLTDLSQHLDAVDTLLDSLHANSQALVDSQPMLDELLTDYGAQHVTDVVGSLLQVIFIFSGLGPLAHSALWLAPLVDSLDAAAKAVVPVLFSNRPLDTTQPSNVKKLVELISTKIIPFVEHGPKVDIGDVTVAGTGPATISADEQTNRIIATLRMIGVVR